MANKKSWLWGLMAVVEVSASRGGRRIPRRLSDGPDDPPKRKEIHSIVVRSRTSPCHTFVIRFQGTKSFFSPTLFDWHWPTPDAPHPTPPTLNRKWMWRDNFSFLFLSFHTTAAKLISCSRGNKTTPRREQESKRLYIVIVGERLKKRGKR